MNEKYCYNIGEQGQESLGILEICFNGQTEYFLRKHGVKSGMKVLDIGCGLGFMTQTMANIVGDTGKVVAIDNSENQINAAKARTPDNLKDIIDYKVHDIYELDTLGESFDVVYCRFVLHHVHKPRYALQKIKSVLKPGGLYIGIEGIINNAYSYPSHPAWQSPNLVFEVKEGEDRNGNIGKILPSLIKQAGMECLESSIFQPFLIDNEVRQSLLKNECIENKEFLINDCQMTENEWQAKYNNLKSCIEDDDTLIALSRKIN